MKKKGRATGKPKLRTIRLTENTKLSLDMVEEAFSKILKKPDRIKHVEILLFHPGKAGDSSKKDTEPRNYTSLVSGLITDDRTFLADVKMNRAGSAWIPKSVSMQVFNSHTIEKGFTHEFEYPSKEIGGIQRIGKAERIKWHTLEEVEGALKEED